MPSRQQHLDKARHNELASQAFEQNGYADWAVTTLFYAAVHLVEAYLAPREHSQDHRERNRSVSSRPNLKPVWKYYKELYNRSLDARYKCLSFTPTAVRNLRASSFEPLKARLRPSLGI